MGLLDKIKQAKNFVTGGGANVTVTPESQISDRSQPVKVKINATIKDASLNAKFIYLKVRGQERVTVRNVNVSTGDGSRKQDVTDDATTYETEVRVADEQTLEANQSYSWDAEFTIPGDVAGTYRGRNAWHEWEVQAALDVPGNDPDSGWVAIEVK